MSQWDMPPVPTGPEYPGAGGQLRLRSSRDGKTTSLQPIDGAQIDDKIAAVLGRVAGLWIAGMDYPLFKDQQRTFWIREARPGLLKFDLDHATILCGASVDGGQRDRILQALQNSRQLSEAGELSQFVSFVPMVKAGLRQDVIYYIEAPYLPQVVFPDLIRDSLRLIFFSICETQDVDAYIEAMAKGNDSRRFIETEPLFRNLMTTLSDERRRQFTIQIGEQIQRGVEGQ